MSENINTIKSASWGTNMILVPVRVTGREIEWMLAFGTIGFGVWLIAPMTSMDGAAFVALRRSMTEGQWGAFFVVTGLIHAAALLINGAAWWTPIVRMVCSGLTAYVYISFAVGFFMVDRSTTAVFTYLYFPGGMAWMSVYRAARDSRMSWRRRFAGK